MSNSAPKVPIAPQRSSLYWFLIFILYMIMAAFSTSFLVGQLLNYIFSGSPEASVNFIIHPEQYPGQEALYVSIQALASMLLFIGGSWFFLKRENGPLLYKLSNPINNFKSNNLYKAVGIMTILIPATFLVEEVNILILENIVNDDIKTLLEESQAASKAVYDYLLSVPNISVLLLSIVGLGVIPAVGEELVFRGVLQNLFLRSFKNRHAAIWISAFLFSLFHGNWDGFIVRLILGGLFGYIYFQTKNIYVPIAAHAINNSISLILGYLITNQIIDIPYNYSFISEGTWPGLVIYSSIAIAFSVYFLSSKNKNGFRLG